METPLISIIVPTYNRAKLITNALDSVLEQTYHNWECIVIDDGSKDETRNVINAYQEKDSRILFLERIRQPKGAPTCRNVGLNKAKGEYIIFLDSDDYLLPFCLEQRLNKFNQDKDYDFLVFPMAEKRNDSIIKKEIPVYDNYLIPFLSANLPWQTMCPIWKKKFLLELKGFTEGYPRFNDPELMIRALLQEIVTFKVYYELNYDTVFVPSIKDKFVYIDKVFYSLCLFIPDISSYLEANNKGNYKKYLANYLHLWFKYFYIPLETSKINKSLKLISLFKGLGIITISKTMSLSLRLFLYSFTQLIFKNPIDKLSDKTLYIKR